MNLDAIGDKLRAAIKVARAEGLIILAGGMGGRRSGCCCPLGALVLDSRYSEGSTQRYDEAMAALGLPKEAWEALAYGFDMSARDTGFPELRALGEQLRREVDEGSL